MAPKPKSPPKDPVVTATLGRQAPGAAAAEEQLQVVESIGLAKVARGWVVVGLSTQGDKVIGREVLSEVEPKSYAVKRAQNEILKAFLVLEKDVSA